VLTPFAMSLPPFSEHDRDGSSNTLVTEIPETAKVMRGLMRHRLHRLDGTLVDAEERA